MPELPEVETVRDGLARHVVGRRVLDAQVLRDYSVRRHLGGPADLVGRVQGRTLAAAVRRGKFLWVPLTGDRNAADEALLVHLGMSGQLLVRSSDELAAETAGDRAVHPHLRVRFVLDDGGALDFVDQRTFGHVSVQDLVPTPDGAPGGRGSSDATVPEQVAHIARDLLDPALDLPTLVRAVRSRRTGIKRALLDQTLVSGVGNIYADEALWRAQVHFARPTSALRPVGVRRVLDAAAQVMSEALAQGGTSFDALYVNVNGASGYFDRSLAVYGQEGRPCPRCGTPIRRVEFMNRSSAFCPRCQPAPRTPRAARSPRT
ncbi:bifunctional DNA-formamidopyrimidine glycosylase/DNA-(apurinic or apyrimidinic site) lyase [Cellulomonas palmilytica]|uniref:bifunctional DNA-formamidopyrimidine glycosylase/DNA-(apurinic or apyrimidinic site) lyase n=1 Tax=Cellulomonas palmilytica TaxID=2608402 RepID=UPI001F25CBBB|nr:bifunctional DNA-formamidopyrimidine glycosylase/DNA-(apurinic or apyrimidinic site) lyase [Cellulomonas palmilytica]UJP39478.1 bifunctional DNA-formamidopyrimidine glycosylase/DNA-(apurinic or apyrimidinic site) lyase [Cellulomonas palmilytica]